MANEQHAYITVQGDVNSRKGSNANGYVVMAPVGTKTFRNSLHGRHDGLTAAVVWCTKKGYQSHMVKPILSARNGSQVALLDERFKQATEIARNTIAAAKAEA